MHELCTGGMYHPEVYELTKWRTVRDICKYIGSVIDDNPICIETGTTYFYLPEALEHHTTNNIAKYICAPKKGLLYSLDIDPQVEMINSLFKDDEVSTDSLVMWQVDSVQGIQDVGHHVDQVDLVCLDSAEDATHMVNEYKMAAPMLKDKHFVLVDDIHNEGSVKYLDMVPMLKKLGYKWVQVPTPTGMFVAAKGYDIP